MKEEQAIRGGWKASRVYSQRVVKKRIKTLVQHNKNYREYYAPQEDFSKRVFEMHNNGGIVHDEGVNAAYIKEKGYNAEYYKAIKRQIFWNQFWFYSLIFIFFMFMAFVIYEGSKDRTAPIVQKHSISKYK